MEQLRTELSHLLGEKLSRVECVSEKPSSALWSLYDAQGNPMPLLARSFTTPGVARQLAWKISTLARSGTVRMPVVYGVMTHEEHPGPDVLLIERLRGVSVEAPARTPERWEQLQEQIVEALLAWHRQDSGGCVGMVDSTQENLWPYWYPPACRGAMEHAEPLSGYRPDDAGQTHSVPHSRMPYGFV